MERTEKDPPEVFRSMSEFRQRFFPRAEAERREAERSKDPAKYGTGLAEETARAFRRELRTQMARRNQS